MTRFGWKRASAVKCLRQDLLVGLRGHRLLSLLFSYARLHRANCTRWMSVAWLPAGSM